MHEIALYTHWNPAILGLFEEIGGLSKIFVLLYFQDVDIGEACDRGHHTMRLD